MDSQAFSRALIRLQYAYSRVYVGYSFADVGWWGWRIRKFGGTTQYSIGTDCCRLGCDEDDEFPGFIATKPTRDKINLFSKCLCGCFRVQLQLSLVGTGRENKRVCSVCFILYHLLLCFSCVCEQCLNILRELQHM